MSRRPIPTHLKLVTGNPGRRPLNKRDVARAKALTQSRPAAPPHLSTRAKRAWTRMLKLLTGAGVIEATDALALERLCETYAEILDAQDRLLERGSRTYETTSVAGGRMVRAYPEVAMLADADRRFKSYLVEMGMTPAARCKVGGGNSDPDETNLGGYFS